MPDQVEHRADSISAPATRYVPVTKTDSDLPDGMPKALLVGIAGTANLVDAAGETRSDLPLQQGYNPIRCRLVLPGGTADRIWALY